MKRKFDIIKKYNLPDDANIKGFTFLKDPSKYKKSKFDFVEMSNGNEIGCMLLKRKSSGFTKGYVKVDESVSDYLEVKTKSPFIILLFFILMILIGFLAFMLLNRETDETGNKKPIFDLSPDSGLEYGDRPEKSKEEIEAELNEKVQEGMMNISMNLNPAFENGTSEGNLLIVNEEINRHPQIVEIYRKDTNELIYRSGLVPVGGRVDYGKLLIDLDKGEYPCVAYFNSINGETGELLGKAGAEIIIIVLG